MKKNILAVFAVAIFVASCSKEKKLNRRLDGEWNVTSADGDPIVAPATLVLKFEKEKGGKGTCYITSFDGTDTDIDTASYYIGDHDEISMIFDGDVGIWTVLEYSKDEMKIDAEGSFVEATKK